MSSPSPVPDTSDSQVARPREPSARAPQARSAGAKPAQTDRINNARPPQHPAREQWQSGTANNYLTGSEWVFMAPTMAISVLVAALVSWSVSACNRAIAYLFGSRDHCRRLQGRAILNVRRKARRRAALPAGNCRGRPADAAVGWIWPPPLLGRVRRHTLAECAGRAGHQRCACASIILSGRLPAMVAGQIALWTGACLLHPLACDHPGACCAALASAFVTAFRQARLDRETERKAGSNSNASRCGRKNCSPNMRKPGRAGSGKPTGAASITYLSPTISTFAGPLPGRTDRQALHRTVHSR